MFPFRRRAGTALTALVLAVPLAVVATDTAALAADTQYERLLNGTFDSGSKEPWWTSGNTPASVVDGRLCADIPAGTVNPWDALVGQDDVPFESGQPYTLRFDASATRAVDFRAVAQLAAAPYTSVLNETVSVTTTPQTFTFTANSTVDGAHGQVTFQLGGATAAYTLCLDNISFVGGVVPPGGVRDFGSPVRVNQVGYLANGPKRATYVTDATGPLAWRLLDSAGTAVATGNTSPYGADAMSGENVQRIDFGTFHSKGQGYRLAVGDDVSEPFDIGANIYKTLRGDALAYFYNNRSGTPIEAKYVGDAYARPAGHLGIAPNKGDTSVPCFPGTCDYSLDVRGGWYDAGDHGKYVVNGALAAWQLLDLYERSATHRDRGVADRTLRIPEAGNGDPDVLDEAKWEIDFLLRMQVPAGQPLAGMVHHKIHDEKWTGLPLAPAGIRSSGTSIPRRRRPP